MHVIGKLLLLIAFGARTHVSHLLTSNQFKNQHAEYNARVKVVESKGRRGMRVEGVEGIGR